MNKNVCEAKERDNKGKRARQPHTSQSVWRTKECAKVGGSVARKNEKREM